MRSIESNRSSGVMTDWQKNRMVRMGDHYEKAKNSRISGCVQAIWER